MAPHPALCVSVVMCTYNGAHFLAGQLQSILQQTHPVDEIIIVDDCSTDNTPDIVAAFTVKNPIIKWHRNEANLGYNKNFEKALLLASGDVLAIADQDDIWHPQKIALLLAHWPAGSPLIYSDSVVFSGLVPQKPRTSRYMHRLQGNDPRTLALYNTISGHAMIIKKELLRLALPFHPQVYYDWWLAVVAAANGGISYLPQILVFQRAHLHNASLQPPKSRHENFIREKKEIERNLQQFCKAPNLTLADQAFFDTLSSLWSSAMAGRQKARLFSFLMQHRQVIYCSKKRKFTLVSQLKRSFNYAFKKM